MAEVLIDRPEATIVVAMSEEEAKNTAAYLGSRHSGGPGTVTLFLALANALDAAGISFTDEYQAIRTAQDEYIYFLVAERERERVVPNPFALAVGKEVVLVKYPGNCALGQTGFIVGGDKDLWTVEGIVHKDGTARRNFYSEELRVIG